MSSCLDGQTLKISKNLFTFGSTFIHINSEIYIFPHSYDKALSLQETKPSSGINITIMP